MMAPAALSCALVRVCLLLMPKPIMRGIAQIHAVDMVEVSQLGIAETALGASDTCRTDHIDKAIGMLVDEADALLAGFWRNHHDDTDVILVGYRFHHLEIVIKRKVGNNGSSSLQLSTQLLKKASMP